MAAFKKMNGFVVKIQFFVLMKRRLPAEWEPKRHPIHLPHADSDWADALDEVIPLFCCLYRKRLAVLKGAGDIPPPGRGKDAT